MVLGINDGVVSSGALLYLVSSTLTISAFFMLIEIMERGQDAGAKRPGCHHGKPMGTGRRPT